MPAESWPDTAHAVVQHHADSVFGLVAAPPYDVPASRASSATSLGTSSSVATECSAVSPNGFFGGGSQKSSSGSATRSSPNRADCSYWFAQSGENDPGVRPTTTSTAAASTEGAEADTREGGGVQGVAEREERIRLLRERQAEDRQRKLEDLRMAAVQAQKYREMQEEDRRRRIEEIKLRDNERRYLVEERKRLIWEAERERRETMLRKSQEREAKIEARRNAQRGSIAFAFGSCTPRMLDLELPASMMGRRSASQSSMNVLPTPINFKTLDEGGGAAELHVRKRSSPNEASRRGADSVLRHTIHEAYFWEPPQISSVPPTSGAAGGGGGRTTSALCGAGVLVVGEDDLMTQSVCSSLSSSAPMRRGRRKTDLVPTVPLRDGSSRTRSPGRRSLSMTGLDVLAVAPPPRRNRPLEALREEQQQQQQRRRGIKKLPPILSKTKSLGHLAATGSAKPDAPRSRPASARSSPTRGQYGGLAPRTSSHSMWHLAGSSPTNAPRPTRASILRRDARTFAHNHQQALMMSRSMVQLVPGASGSSSSGTDGSSTPAPSSSSPSRPHSSLSQQSLSSQNSTVAGVVSMRTVPTRRPRPMSVAGSVVASSAAAPTAERRGRSVEKRVGQSGGGSSLVNGSGGKPPRAKSVGADRLLGDDVPVPAPRRPKTLETSSSSKMAAAAKEKPKIAPKPQNVGVRKQQTPPPPPQSKKTSEEPPAAGTTDVVASTTESAKPVQTETVAPEVVPVEQSLPQVASTTTEDTEVTREQLQETSVVFEETVPTSPPPPPDLPEEQQQPLLLVAAPTSAEVIHHLEVEEAVAPPAASVDVTLLEQQQTEDVAAMAPVVPKQKITTEEEAKAAIAEKRRLAREQAEREAELERQRQEELRRLEEERIRREEEEQRLWEEEQERSRRAEDERLQKAIEEQQQREEEERLRREEETKLKVEKERAERLAREEQEKARKENEEKLRKEEEERAERRKRVEAIMSRTRGKMGTPPVTTPTKNADPTALMSDEEEQRRQDQEEEEEEEEDDTTPVTTTTEVLQSGENQEENQQHVHTNGFGTHMDEQSTPEKVPPPPMMIMTTSDDYNDDKATEPELDQLIDIMEEAPPTSIVAVAKGDLDHLSNEDNVNFNVTTNGLDDPFVDNYANRREAAVTDLLSS